MSIAKKLQALVKEHQAKEAVLLQERKEQLFKNIVQQCEQESTLGRCQLFTDQPINLIAQELRDEELKVTNDGDGFCISWKLPE